MGLVAVLISYILLSVSLVYCSRRRMCFSLVMSVNNEKRVILRIVIWPLFFAFLFFVFNKYVVGIPILTGDRANYLMDFNGRTTGYVGFDLYVSVIKSLTGDFSFLLAFTTFMCSLITFIAFDKSQYFNSRSMAFLMMTYFIFFTLTALKQAPVAAITGAICVLAIEKKGKIFDILAILLILIGIGFHSTSFILIPLFICLKMNLNGSVKVNILITLLVIVLVFFEPILMLIAQLIQPFWGKFSEIAYQYVGEDSIHNNDGNSLLLVALKGTPYYLLTIAGVKYRKRNSDNPHYDKYLLVSFLSSTLNLASLYSYWYSRFVNLFFLPLAILYSMVISSCSKKERLLWEICILGGAAFFTFRSVILNYIRFGGY